MESIFDVKEIEQRVEQFFSLYDITYGMTRDMCELKVIHSRMVADNCRFIAESMGFDAYDTDLAWVIEELHDYARFGLRSEAAHKRVVEQGYLKQMMDIEFTDPHVQKQFLGLKEEVREHIGLPRDEKVVAEVKRAA